MERGSPRPHTLPAGPAGPDDAPSAGDQQPGGIGILLFDGVEELDAIGPWEVLKIWTRSHPEDGYRVFTVAAEAAPVRCWMGLRVHAEYSLDDCPPLEVLVHPGGTGTRDVMKDERWLDWLRQRRSQTPLFTSVCSGAIVYAAAGLLRNRPATTHRWVLEELAATDTTVDVRRNVRFIDDGDVITSAGISAGIDMALHLVARLAGVERAREVREIMEYDPEPPV
ncbi:putative transcription regulator, AraC family protein [Longimycelium tulufanense]|uniref:Putative transcription regulator, AraC family protein n=1 Tax=Longimycelium tulufanense TaxID=907463 RepID=A0A8J3FTL2_9PSEU|nr:DJ-1/PfpI family protein [Longimycelium tulufanense]GGM41214.1 putative transcription regulator, AraC family protein [Longimycelium tulufanense]